MKSKKLLIILTVVLLAIAGVTTTVAYMFKNTNLFVNIFDDPYVMCSVQEVYDPESGSKSSIKVKNTGNVDEFLRVRLISYWVDGDNNVVGKPSVMPTVSYDSTYWIKGSDDTYYYKSSVAKNVVTEHDLLTAPITLQTSTFTVDGEAETVYQVVEIIPEAIQSRPAKAASEAWGVTTSGTSITAVS